MAKKSNSTGTESILRPVRALVALIDRLWDGTGRTASRGAWRKHVLTATVGVLYVGLATARTSIDGALRKVHPDGEFGFSVNALHEGRATAGKAIETWRNGWALYKPLLSSQFGPRRVAALQTAIELALLPFVFALLYGLVKWLRSRYAAAAATAAAPDEEGLGGGSRRALGEVLVYTAAAVVAYVAFGVVNQVGELLVLRAAKPGWEPGALVDILRYSHYARRSALVLVLATIAIAFVRIRGFGVVFSWVRSAGSAYRVLIALVLVHAALLTISTPGEQSRDAVRIWGDRPTLAIWGFAMTCMFSLSLAVVSLRLTLKPQTSGHVLGRTGTHSLLGAGVAIMAAGWGLHSLAHWGLGVFALGLIATVTALLSYPALSHLQDDTGATEAMVRGTEPPKDSDIIARRVIPSVLTAIPLLVLTHASVKTAMPAVIDDNKARGLIAISLVSGILTIFGFWAARAYIDNVESSSESAAAMEATRTRRFRSLVAGIALVALLLIFYMLSNPVHRAPQIGVHGILGIFMSVLVTTIGAIAYNAEGRGLPAALRLLGVRRVPLVGLVAAWALVGNILPDPGHHGVREIAAPRTDGPTITDAFEAWVAANIDDAGTRAPGDQPRTVNATPLVFVTAAGGGIKAAAFTASTLECLFANLDPKACSGDDDSQPDRWATVFAASGASGGSVGIASMKAERALASGHVDWVSKRLGKDLLTPELSWQLFVETPNALLSFNPSSDRAELLERTWEEQFSITAEATPYFAGSATEPWTGPLTFLNGTDLLTGCRVSISSLQAERSTLADDCRRRRVSGNTLGESATVDLVDLLCPGQNIGLSTAAFLSARFPIVSPVATLDSCPKELGGSDSDAHIAVGDGGYRDNTGAGAVLDTWARLEPLVEQYNRTHDRCIVPLLVEIDNGYANRGARGLPGSIYQPTAPLTGILSVLAARDAGPIEMLADRFDDLSVPGGTAAVPGGSRYARISLYDHPGVTAPLGWSLSDEAVGDLTAQLDRVPANSRQANLVQQWLIPGRLTCVTGG